MLDKTINSALLALRAQIIRGDGKGQDHVEALLRMRGVPLVTVAKPRPQLRSMSRLVLDALRGGPKTGREISGYLVALTGMTPAQVNARVHQALWRLAQAGRVAHEGRLWRMAQ